MRRKVIHRQYEELAPLVAAAFKSMRLRGLCARQNHECCGSCACASIVDFIRDKKKYVGAAYYHHQDQDGFERTGKLYVGFGGRPEIEGDADTLVAGQIVVQCLKECGLAVEWDGTTATRIRVTGRGEIVFTAEGALL